MFVTSTMEIKSESINLTHNNTGYTQVCTHTQTKMHSLLSGPINQSRAEAVLLLLLHLSALWSSCRPFGPTALSALHCDSSDPHIYSFRSQRLMPYLYACTDGTFSIWVWCLVVNCYSQHHRSHLYGKLHLKALSVTPDFLIFGVLVKYVSTETWTSH